MDLPKSLFLSLSVCLSMSVWLSLSLSLFLFLSLSLLLPRSLFFLGCSSARQHREGNRRKSLSVCGNRTLISLSRNTFKCLGVLFIPNIFYTHTGNIIKATVASFCCFKFKKRRRENLVL